MSWTVILQRWPDGAWLGWFCDHQSGLEVYGAFRSLRAAKAWGRGHLGVARAKWTQNAAGTSLTAERYDEVTP